MQVITSERVPILIWSKDPDPKAVDQLKNMANMLFVFHHVAAMPDIHPGLGATVGSVVATKGAIIPAAVGVDLGCGMKAYNTGIKAEEMKPKVVEIYESIKRAIPVGFNKRKEEHPASEAWEGWENIWDGNFKINQPTESIWDNARLQLGTLGGGNHFIELCEDEEGYVWIMLHSGSRGIGNLLANVFIEQAKTNCAKRFISLPDPDLAYLVEGELDFHSYMNEVYWCQDYAWLNRDIMMESITECLFSLGFITQPQTDFNSIHCHHNYVDKESHFGQEVLVTRKGAISAVTGEFGIIPGSMGAKSFIVEGLGNPKSFNSCSHGAGRKMGRKEAKRQFTLEDLAKQTEGITCRKDASVIDEIPSAYKDIDEVMDNQKDLVRIVHTLKQFLCIKG
jgi:tRNA-splicing ligase RtcB